jgi:hypothetical protein
MAPEPMSIAYIINPSHLSLCLYVYTTTVARQRLGKNVIASASTHATIEDLLDACFLCCPCRIEGKYAILPRDFTKGCKCLERERERESCIGIWNYGTLVSKPQQEAAFSDLVTYWDFRSGEKPPTPLEDRVCSIAGLETTVSARNRIWMVP